MDEIPLEILIGGISPEQLEDLTQLLRERHLFPYYRTFNPSELPHQVFSDWDLALIKPDLLPGVLALPWPLPVHMDRSGPLFFICDDPAKLPARGWLREGAHGAISLPCGQRVIALLESSLDQRHPEWRAKLPLTMTKPHPVVTSAVVVVVEKKLLFWDSDFLLLMGVSMEAVHVGMDFFDSFIFRDEDAPPPVWEKFIFNDWVSEPFEFRAKRKTGEELWLEAQCSGIIWEGQSARRLVLTDITHRKQMEADRLQAKKMDAIRQLAGGVAHNVNNTLQGLLGFVELARQSISPGTRAHSDLTKAQQLTLELAAFAGHLQTLVRLKRFHPVGININDLIKHCIEEVREKNEAKAPINLHLGKGAPTIPVDKVQAKSLFLTLFQHAGKELSNSGNINIFTSTREVGGANCAAFPWMTPGEYFSLRMVKKGTGPWHEEMERVFEPYFANPDQTALGGLEMALAQAIARQHGGVIRVGSQDGESTLFELLLPLTQPDGTNPDQPLSMVIPPDSPPKEIPR